MSNGQVLMDDDTRQVVAQPDILEKAFIRPPEIVRVAQALDFGQSILTVDEIAASYEVECQRRKGLRTSC
jgi:hypothetical protein